jgi:hypothetical protein
MSQFLKNFFLKMKKKMKNLFIQHTRIGLSCQVDEHQTKNKNFFFIKT